MSDPRAEFLDAIGLTHDVQMRIASSVEQFLLRFRRCIEDALTAKLLHGTNFLVHRAASEPQQ
jgi:hypothetical protein